MKNSRKNFKQLHIDLVNRILEGDGVASHSQRKDAFNNGFTTEPLKLLIDKVVNCAYTITEKDFDEAKTSGLSEDYLFELVICAAVGQAAKQYDNALGALAEALNKNTES
jgi:hypothetical protein